MTDEANKNDSDDVDAAVSDALEAIDQHIEAVCDDLPFSPDDPSELREVAREDLAYAARNHDEYIDFPVAYRCEEYRVVSADISHRGVVDSRLDDYDFDAESMLVFVYSSACKSAWDWASDRDGGVARVVPKTGGDEL